VPQSRHSLWVTAGPCCFISSFTLASCATLLSNAVPPERQGSVMGNNQALQVGAEAAGALVGGLLAAVDVTVPLVSFGILLVVGGLMLVSLRTSAPAKVAASKVTRISTGSFLTPEWSFSYAETGAPTPCSPVQHSGSNQLYVWRSSAFCLHHFQPIAIQVQFIGPAGAFRDLLDRKALHWRDEFRRQSRLPWTWTD
jgi:MFS family permease